MSQQHDHRTVAAAVDDADSRVDMWSALTVLVAIACAFVLFASSFDGAL